MQEFFALLQGEVDKMEDTGQGQDTDKGEGNEERIGKGSQGRNKERKKEGQGKEARVEMRVREGGRIGKKKLGQK